MFIQNIFGTIQSSRVIFFCYFFRVLRAGQVGYSVRRRHGPGTLATLGHSPDRGHDWPNEREH